MGYFSRLYTDQAYHYEPPQAASDLELTMQYESNGLFAKIIDMPSEEAVKHGFELVSPGYDFTKTMKQLDSLDWELHIATAIKWARIFGGSIIVLLLNDGRDLSEPINYRQLREVRELRVYDRSIVEPETSRAGTVYKVDSIYGTFKVHESRCLTFHNNRAPESTTDEGYLLWGVPEYDRIKDELTRCLTAHSYGPMLLERACQTVLKLRGLAGITSMADGTAMILQRLRLLEQARGLLNSIAIDADGEQFELKTISLQDVDEIIKTTYNLISGVTGIPQKLLFGVTTGEDFTLANQDQLAAMRDSSMELYYNMVARLQAIMLRANLKKLVRLIVMAETRRGCPDFKLNFKPLWSKSETEELAIKHQKALAAQQRAAAEMTFVRMGALDVSEVRQKLKGQLI
jgi:phage-related protein (TIGR01555 family)